MYEQFAGWIRWKRTEVGKKVCLIYAGTGLFSVNQSDTSPSHASKRRSNFCWSGNQHAPINHSLFHFH